MDYISLILNLNKYDQISKEGNSIVYKKNNYVIKIIDREKSKTNEIRVLKALSKVKSSKHFISRYYKSIESNSNVYIIMEALTGPDLFYMAHRNLGITQYKDIFKHLLLGLNFIHQNNIVHRDIKLENIVLDNGYPKYIDFGHAILLDNIGYNFRAGGTIKCLSPELLTLYSNTIDFSKHHEIKKILISSDIWALGISFYELINNQIAFCDENLNLLKIDIVNRNIVSHSNTFLDSIIEDMLTKDYLLRPTINEILVQLSSD